MARQLDDWLSSYLEYTKNHEATEKLHFWCGAAIISAALKRQVRMDRGFYTLYPNLYVLIVAESARARKSLAMDLAIHLLRDSVPDIFYISGSMTPEGFIKHLNREKSLTEINDKEGKKVTIQLDSHCILHSDELAETFSYDRTRASRFTILLTKIYGAQDEHTHTLATEKQVSLHKLYPVFLAGTDQSNLKVLPEEAIGGLIGRTIFVTESKKKRAIAWPSTDAMVESAALYKLLKHDLYNISILMGEIKPTNDARELFRLWYEKLSEQTSGDRRIDAFRERCHDTAMKLAMILAVSRGDELIVKENQMQAAINHIERQTPEFTKISDWTVTNVYSQNRARFMEYMVSHNGAGVRSQAMKILRLNLEEMMVLESSLEQEQTIDIRIAGRAVFYKLKESLDL